MEAVAPGANKRKADQEDGPESKKLKLVDSVVEQPATAPATPNYDKMKVQELKEECRKRGLKVSGNKSELIERLTTGVNTSSTRKSTSNKAINMSGRTNPKGVDSRLEALHVEKINSVSKCLRKGIQLGHIDLSGDDPLSNVVLDGKCCCCDAPLRATVKELLYQPDYAGLDYEDGGDSAPVQCTKCQNGNYVTHLCHGKPEFDSGKFHNHCTRCPGFGQCIGDYRESHCENCGKHFFQGLSGFSCPNCSRRRGFFGGDADESDDSDREEGCCVM
jgi:hypothetical protein